MPTAPPASEHKKPAAPKVPAAGHAQPTAQEGASRGPTPGQQRFDRLAVRAKLAVSEPGDAVEREADAVAEKVMRAPDPASQSGTSAPKPSPQSAAKSVNRFADAAAKPATANTPQATTPKTTEKANTPVPSGHPKPSSTEGTHGGTATKGTSAAADIARSAADRDAAGRLSVPTDFADKLGAGEPLDAQTRAYFEQRMDADFSDVRIHTDSAADLACKQINAHAFTFGRHIVFANGQYQPGTAQGKQLLAHELAHVLQQATSVSRQISREAASSSPPAGNANEIALKGVEIPAFKFAGYAGKTFKRKANFSRKNKGSESKQSKHWREATADGRSKFASTYGLKDGALYVATPKKVPLAPTSDALLLGEPKVLAEAVTLPKWNKQGATNKHDIDHIIELQIGGIEQDNQSNIELRDSAANQASGRNIDASITKKLSEVKDKENGDAEKIRANPDYILVFSDFKSVAGGENSSVWLKEDINALKAAEALTIYDPDASADAGMLKSWPKNIDKVDFFGAPDTLVLYPSKRGGKPQKIKLKPDGTPANSKQLPKDWIPGFSLDEFVLNPGSGDQLGSLKFTFDVARVPKDYPLPVVPIRKLSSSLSHAGFVSVEGVRNKISQLLNGKTPVPQTSPVTINEESIDILPGTGLTLAGQIHPSVAILGGPIDFSIAGRNLEFSKTFTNDELKVPGPFKVSSSSLTVAFNTGSGFAVTGFVGFGIPNLGEGSLVGKGQMGSFMIAGTFLFDKKLFDGKAELSATYKKEGEAGKFSGTAKLEISEKKIKGIKKATIDATIDDEKFTLDGKADTSIPGIKQFSVGIKFVDADNFSISGTGELEKLPGIESGSLSMTLERDAGEWALSGKGAITPKLPGGAKGTIDGSYKNGVVLIRGNVHFSYGDKLLDGSVLVAVTNAASVDKDGNASGEGGKDFKIFGEGELNAALIKDKLDGKVKLRLLPDGSVRVGGGLKAKDFEVFGKYPKDGGEFLNKPFSTPPVPIPGLGFSVGSVSVGVTFSASLTAKAHASIGPGKLTGISLTLAEFDPANIDLNTLELGGGGTFAVYADAGFGLTAKINLIFGAAIAELVGSVGAEASVGIPADKPIISAATNFTYSQAKGLDINAGMNLDISPKLKFRLFGEVSARLNLLVDTVTVWKKDWTLAEANYKLPVGIKATGKLGYNSKTGKITPEKPADAISVEQPKLDADAMKGVVAGDKAPPRVINEAKDQGAVNPTPQVNPKREDNTAANPNMAGVDENLLNHLGPSIPLDDKTRSFFEQRMNTDFSRVQIHTNPGAALEAEKLGAKAFTVGDHIAFADGLYQPETPAGKELLAHELAHVVQHDCNGSIRRVVDEPLPPNPSDEVTQAYNNLSRLELPPIKHRHNDLFRSWPAVRRRGYNRSLSQEQVSVWRSGITLDPGRVTERLRQRFNDPGFVTPRDGSRAELGFKVGGESRSIRWSTALNRTFLIPDWDRTGNKVTGNDEFQVDHMVELQVAGDDSGNRGNVLRNLELLNGSLNMSSGATIAASIRTHVRDWLSLTDSGWANKTGAQRETAISAWMDSHTIEFDSPVNTAEGPSGDETKWWSQTEINDLLPLDNITPPDSISLAGSPGRFLLVSGAGNIVYATFRYTNLESVTPRPNQVGAIKGLSIQEFRLNTEVESGAPGTQVGHMLCTWNNPQGLQPTEQMQIPLVAKAAYCAAPAETPGFTTHFTHLSPIAFSQTRIEDDRLVAEGALTPTLSFLGGGGIDVQLSGDDLRFRMSYSAGALNLPIPGLSIFNSELSVFYSSSDGFGAGGQIDFGLANLGSGQLNAEVSTEGGLALLGGFDFDPGLFDRAHVGASYEDDQLSIEGEIGIDSPNKIRGIRAANLSVAYSSSQFSAEGTVDPNIPGIQQAGLRVNYGEDTGLVIGGNLQLEANAAIRSGSIDVTLSKVADTWRVAATGTAQPAIPGIDSTLTVVYDDGAFDANFSGSFERGMLSGTAEVGATNRSLDEAGEPTGPAEPGAPIIVYGGGSATLQIAPWLEGTAGIRFAPDGEVTVSGEIGLPDALEIFPRQEINRELFALATQIPIAPGIVAEVGGNLNASAGIGPGMLDQAVIHIDYTPAREEDTHVTGDAHLNVPADAGLRLAARAGIGVGITGASATGGLELGGTIGIAGAAEASVHVDWMPSTGLSIDAAAEFSAEPRFRFDISGYVDVSVLGASLYEQRWELAAYEFGSDYRFGVRFPVHYQEGEPFTVSTDDIEFEVPDIDPEALVRQLGAEIV